jgi:hypothetical protein
VRPLALESDGARRAAEAARRYGWLRSSLNELGAGKRAGEKSLRRLSNSRSTFDVPSDERGVPPHLHSELSESQARRASALKSTLGPLATFLDDPRVVEVMLNADGVVWIDRIGEGLLRTSVTMTAADAERMLRLVASEVLVELNPQSPSLSAKLPAPWGARLQAAIPPIVDAPVFALPQRPPTDRSNTIGRSEKPELARRRYDWSPAPGGVDAVAPKPRNRSPDRDR